MLSAQNKKKLRSLAVDLPSMIQIGKGNLSETFFEGLDAELEAHELVKVTLQKTSTLTVREAAIECASETGSEVIQTIGRTFVLYRQSKNNKLGISK
ncbi:YhbY family RNA-binding protein [Erysipelotrichaceae bacterium 51-3]|uniref:YhbY family RNA-binding protein n=1 Tax=Allobaculum sp. JKK-2023 TaxID=3108943 RepID=UPI002B05E97E|nr:YhbY family RNA-binding protein [Allobaculum sp. JKK-2023]